MDEHALECLRKAGAISREARELGIRLVDEGKRLVDVANEIEAYIIRRGARPAFPVNIGVNDIAAHFSPSTDDKTVFQRGDLVKVDVGAHVDGYVGDTAATIEISTKNWRPLIDSSAKALRIAIEMIGENVSVCQIGGAIERAIKIDGYKPVVNLTGHGMKRYDLHAGLTLPNIDDGNTAKVKTDMVIAIEPFATNGGGQVYNDHPGNIYRVLRVRSLQDKRAGKLLEEINTNFGGLPFCERWCTLMMPDAPTLLKTLIRHGAIACYPVLREVKSGMVSQSEHTTLILNGKAEVTT
jgi:methionyl aminopeptidase